MTQVLLAVAVPLIGGVCAVLAGALFEFGRALLDRERRAAMSHRSFGENVHHMLS